MNSGASIVGGSSEDFKSLISFISSSSLLLSSVSMSFIAFLIIVRTGKICVYGYSRPVAYYDLFGLL